jgi:hypothetical protein
MDESADASLVAEQSTPERPSLETLRVMADDLGLRIQPDRLAAAARDLTAFRPKLEELRQFKFPYLHPVEPGHVRQWIENGGHCVAGAHHPIGDVEPSPG